MEQPAVSVIMPVYNVAGFLRQCLDSVVGQTLENLEIIAIDDGSTDESGAILDEYAAVHPNLTVVHKENGGYGVAINRGLSLARGTYVGIVETDDYIDPAMFEKLYAAAEGVAADGAPLPDVVKGAYWRVVDANTPQEEILPAWYMHKVTEGRPFSLAEDTELLYHHPSIWTAIYRRAFLEDKGIRMMEVPGAAWVDNPFMIETLVQADSILYIDEALYYYREFNAGSSSTVKNPQMVADRFADMDAVLRRLDVTSPDIWEGHYHRGCVYIENMEASAGAEGVDDDALQAAIVRIRDLIDYDAVYASKRIPGHFKDAYQRHVSRGERLAHKVKRLSASRAHKGDGAGGADGDEAAAREAAAAEARKRAAVAAAIEAKNPPAPEVRPAITVISPVYNAMPFLRDCAKSCLGQTLENIEVIFVDDGSTDESLLYLEGLMHQDSRVRVYTQENSGPSVARNRGLDEARGEFLYFIDSDDYIPEKTALERLYRAAVDNGVPVAGGSMCLDRDGTVDFDSLHGRALDSFAEEAVIDYRDYQYDYDFTRFIYSLDLIRENGIRFPGLKQFEDPVFYVKVMLAAKRFATIPDAVYAYRYGHQVYRKWAEQAAIDRFRGMIELLDLSREEGMAKLHWYVYGQMDSEMTGVVLDWVGSPAVMDWVFRGNSAIDTALLQQVDPDIPDHVIIEPLRIILESSRSSQGLALAKAAYRKARAVFRRMSGR